MKEMMEGDKGGEMLEPQDKSARLFYLFIYFRSPQSTQL